MIRVPVEAERSTRSAAEWMNRNGFREKIDLMKIPEASIIAEEKFTRYLLLRRDYDDKSRYLEIAGFTIDNHLLLMDEIRKLVSENDAVEERSDEYGTFFKVSGKVTGPNGAVISIITVWMQRKVDGIFQFVTLISDRRD